MVASLYIPSISLRPFPLCGLPWQMDVVRSFSAKSVVAFLLQASMSLVLNGFGISCFYTAKQVKWRQGERLIRSYLLAWPLR